MSEQEFESYLNLLARTLRLSESQRTRIAGELRDHLEARMTELMEEDHLSKEDAVLAALDEFGDANVLAHDLTGPATQLKRKRIMQTGFSVIATAAVVATAATYLVPNNFQGHVTQPLAKAAPTITAPDATPESATSPVHTALNQRVSVDFDETPLENVFQHLRENYYLNVYAPLDPMEQAGLDRTYPISLRLNDVPLRMVLDLLMAELSYTIDDGVSTKVGYSVKDNVLVFTLLEPAATPLHTQMYDCRELILNTLKTEGIYEHQHEVIEHLQRFARIVLGKSAWEKDTSVYAYGTLLVVHQTAPRQARLRTLLDDLNHIVAEQAAEAAEAKEAQAAIHREDTIAGDFGISTSQ